MWQEGKKAQGWAEKAWKKEHTHTHKANQREFVWLKANFPHPRDSKSMQPKDRSQIIAAPVFANSAKLLLGSQKGKCDHRKQARKKKKRKTEMR